MLSKCANPGCDTPFQYLRDGKLFQIEIDASGRALPTDMGMNPGNKAVRLEHFWLCGACSAMHTLGYKQSEGVIMLPLPPARRVSAA